MTTKELHAAAHALYEGPFQQAQDDVERYAVPFPVAVFGTLRKLPKPHWNTRCIETREPIGHEKSFLPHFSVNGIFLHSREGASCVMETYHHTPEDWAVMIKTVDRLESFSPTGGVFGYHRTLVKMRMLPDDYQHDLFDQDIRVDDRSLEIPEDEWDQFPWIPAWTYSNEKSNLEVEAFLKESKKESPILWRRTE